MIIGKSPMNNSREAEDLQELVDKGHLTLQVQVSPVFTAAVSFKIQSVINRAFPKENLSFKCKSKIINICPSTAKRAV